MKVFLIRHGQTTGDLEDKYGGWYDDDLTELGREQLAVTASSLVDKGVQKIFASSLKRALQSAEIINSVLNVELEIVPGLRERNYGVLGGLTKVEAMEKYPDAVALHKDPNNTDPEGESRAVFIDRVLNSYNEITTQSYDSVIILGHGGSIKAILSHVGIPLPDSIGDGEIIEIHI